jgi:predicted PurR-regulated permease PerM
MPDLPVSPIPSRAQVAPAEIPGVNALLTLAAAVVFIAALFLAREVLIPVTLAILLSFVLAPLVELLRKARLPRVLAVLLAVVVAIGIILALAGLIGTQIASLVGDFPRYQYTIEQKVDAVEHATTERLSQLVSRFGHQLDRATPVTPPGQPPAAPEATDEPKPVPVEVHQPSPSQMELVQRYIAPVLSPLATLAIVVIVSIFVLLQQEDLRDRLIRLFGSRDLHRTTVAMDDAARRLSKYFLTQLGINASFGVIIGAGLFFIGVPSPILFGVMAALLRFVPYIGAPLAALFPLALAAAVDPGWSMVLWTLGLFVVVEPIMGQVVEPVLYGHSTGLSPFSVVVAAIFWTWLWGPIGLILSTPLTLCLVVLGRHVDRLEFLDVLLGDRPALTPIESFYQRMLAGDPDEAIDFAELLLKERSLSSYYDEVALKGLQLAAHDVTRGVLQPEQLERIKDAIASLVEDLDDHDDVDPAPDEADDGPVAPTRAERALPAEPAPTAEPPDRDALPENWRGEGAVLCVAGRGPLDEAAAAMLAQLLSKHGLGSRVEPHHAVSRAGIAGLDVTGVAMVCISYLEITGTPSHLRYLLRRVRQKVPGAPILVGLWPAEEAVLRDDRLRAAVGADYYATSLREAVTACLEAARGAEEASARAA